LNLSLYFSGFQIFPTKPYQKPYQFVDAAIVATSGVVGVSGGGEEMIDVGEGK